MVYFKIVDANALIASRTLYLKNVEVSYNKLLLVEVHCSIFYSFFILFSSLSSLSHSLSSLSISCHSHFSLSYFSLLDLNIDAFEVEIDVGFHLVG